MVRVTIVVFMLVHEQALVGFGLDHREHAIHGGGDQRHQQRLPGAEVTARQRAREHQHDHRQRENCHQILFNTARVDVLGGELAPAEQQRETDRAGGNDHDDGIQRVAHQRRRGVAGGHQRRDQADLEDHHRQAEDQRAVGFPKRWASTSAWRTTLKALLRIPTSARILMPTISGK